MLQPQNDSNNTRNIMLALAVSLLVLFGWQAFFGPKPETESDQPAHGDDRGDAEHTGCSRAGATASCG